jgi:hypothetical protein
MRDENHVLSQDTRAPELSELSGRIFLSSLTVGDDYIAAAEPQWRGSFCDSGRITFSKAVKMVGLMLVTVAALSSLAFAAPNNLAVKGDWKSKIKNVVILVEENRSFDTFAGGLSYNSAIDGLLHHNYCNSM